MSDSNFVIMHMLDCVFSRSDKDNIVSFYIPQISLSWKCWVEFSLAQQRENYTTFCKKHMHNKYKVYIRHNTSQPYRPTWP